MSSQMSTASATAAARRLPRLADAALTRARLSVVPRVRSRAPRVPFVLLVSLLLVGGVIGLLMFNTSMQQTSFAASRLEQQAATLSAREQALSMQVESLRNPQRVAEQAQAMGMRIPVESCFLALSGSQPDCSGGAAAAPLRLQPLAPVKPAILDPPAITVPAPEPAGTGDGKNKSKNKSKNKPANASTNPQDTGSASPGSGAARDRNNPKPDRSTR